jgi:hypothetical protein
MLPQISDGRENQLRSLFLSAKTWSRYLLAWGTASSTTFERRLPEERGCNSIRIRVSLPAMPGTKVYAFADHVLDAEHRPTDRVLATCTGGFAISEDLGRNWRPVMLRDYAHLAFVNAKMLPSGEVLLQAIEPDQTVLPPDEMVHLIVADLGGKVLHQSRLRGARWHGPRAIDTSGDTLMYAEYTRNGPRRGPVPRRASRVFRSRNFGRSWEMVVEEAGVRHFHFLQARPNRIGKWWLASGDGEAESRIWKSVDDGDSWIDQTAAFGAKVKIGESTFSRRLFRLTDLMWDDENIVWGSDDALLSGTRTDNGIQTPAPGSRVFHGDPGSGRPPDILGTCGGAVRNMVQVAEHYLLLTQSSPLGDATPPGVFLMWDTRAAPLHLFDVGRYSAKDAGFTLSRASRGARNGVFFTYCPARQLFDLPHQILKWEVEIV